ncbi:DsbA family protein [Hydrogenophaga sp.]|uniref:DsbA family protein n=1 Tax=Hydrogenophaga sp. TaxID=1904254 RepID=UPI0025B822F5|nr:DsbA family protein [Hydrogenophaga sp.]MBT9463643.1 DsbA family protein [Hydrogenophaga sp.]
MSKTLHYVFDPLCGWCYGASATVSALSRNPGIQLRLLPSGLFCGEGARSMDEDFASYAWANDQRIASLTGQTFSDRYRSEVLADRQQVFDSGPATVALSAVALTAPQRELDALKVIQRARYVDGLDVTRADTLATVLKALGLDRAAARMAMPDAALLQANRARIDQAQALLQTFGARGVPTFILEEDGRRELLPAGSVYSDPQAFVDQFATA